MIKNILYEAVKNQVEQSSRKHYKRGEIVYHEGEAPQNLYLIEKGMVGLFHLAESGKETFFRVFGPKDIFGHRSYFAEESYHASSICLAPVDLTVISKKDCDLICGQSPELLKEISKLMAKDLGRAELRMAGLLDKTAHKRISESLVYLKLKYPDYVWTRKEIAEYSGSSFETVARVITVLENKQLLKRLGRDYVLLEPEKLLTLSESELH